MSEKVLCAFYNVGFCKFKDLCPKFHPKEECLKFNCKRKGCFKRHKRWCRYGQECRRFRKDKNCAFKHSINNSEDATSQISDMKNQMNVMCDKIKVLENLLEAKDKEIASLSAKKKSIEEELKAKNSEILSLTDQLKSVVKTKQLEETSDEIFEDAVEVITLKCQNCIFKCVDEIKLEQHIQIEHKIKCSKCKFTFKNENRLDNHMKLAHKFNQNISLDLNTRMTAFLENKC